MIIFYIRHGDPIYEPDSLTPLGEEQAQAVARRLALYGVDEIYSSTSNRAIQTARPTAELLSKEITPLDFLNENYLDSLKLKAPDGSYMWLWSHPEYSKILCSREVRKLGDLWHTHPSLKEHHFDAVIEPINAQQDAFIASLGYEHDREKGLYKINSRNAEKRIAIFAHECIGKIFMSHLLDIPFPLYAEHFEMHTSAMSVIEFDDGTLKERKKDPFEYARARVLSLSNDSHLYRDGLPTNYQNRICF